MTKRVKRSPDGKYHAHNDNLSFIGQPRERTLHRNFNGVWTGRNADGTCTGLKAWKGVRKEDTEVKVEAHSLQSM